MNEKPFEERSQTEELRLVARRNRDGEKKYNRKRGYEWKWLGPNNLEGVK